jgi:hypothetical protein
MKSIIIPAKTASASNWLLFKVFPAQRDAGQRTETITVLFCALGRDQRWLVTLAAGLDRQA